MTDLVLECDSCGHLMRVSEFAIGARGTCTDCGVELKVTLANTRPSDDEQLGPMGSVSTADAETVIIGQVDGDHCARCGRAFRGDWDQYQSAHGMVCHVCANRAEAPGAVQEEVGEVKPVMQAYSREGLDMPEPKLPPNPEFIAARRREELFRRAVLFAALAMIALAIFVTIFGDLDVTPVVDPEAPPVVASESETEAEEVPKLPAWVPWAIYAIQFVVNFGAKVAVLFLMLTWVNKLPNDTFGANLIAIGVVGFGLTVLDVVIMMFASIPFVGIIFGLLGPILMLYFIYSLYGLTFAELLLYFVAYVALLGVVAMTRILLMGLLSFAVL